MKLYVVVTVCLLCVCLLPQTAFAQDTEDEGFDIRGRIASLIERFVTEEDAAAATEAEDAAALEADSAETTPLDPTLVSGVVGGTAIAIAVMLILRGFQSPSKPDPFRTRW